MKVGDCSITIAELWTYIELHLTWNHAFRNIVFVCFDIGHNATHVHLKARGSLFWHRAFEVERDFNA